MTSPIASYFFSSYHFKIITSHNPFLLFSSFSFFPLLVILKKKKKKEKKTRLFSYSLFNQWKNGCALSPPPKSALLQNLTWDLIGTKNSIRRTSNNKKHHKILDYIFLMYITVNSHAILIKYHKAFKSYTVEFTMVKVSSLIFCPQHRL